jgi:hypothetical protein
MTCTVVMKEDAAPEIELNIKVVTAIYGVPSSYARSITVAHGGGGIDEDTNALSGDQRPRRGSNRSRVAAEYYAHSRG